MKKLIMWNVVTVDGYFEGAEPWDLSFHELVWGDELEQYSIEQLDTVAALIFGSKTYAGMAAHFSAAQGEVEDRMNAIKKYVCSSTMTSADWNNTEILSDAVASITKLKEEGEGNLFIFGSGDLSRSLMQAGLFDEYRLCIAPIILGKGKRLFAAGVPQEKLSLFETKTLASGGLIVKYRVGR